MRKRAVRTYERATSSEGHLKTTFRKEMNYLQPVLSGSCAFTGGYLIFHSGMFLYSLRHTMKGDGRPIIPFVFISTAASIKAGALLGTHMGAQIKPSRLPPRSFKLAQIGTAAVMMGIAVFLHSQSAGE